MEVLVVKHLCKSRGLPKLIIMRMKNSCYNPNNETFVFLKSHRQLILLVLKRPTS